MDLLQRYILENSSPEDELMKELDRQTNLRVIQPRMISGHVQGKFLEMITRMINPQSVLEIGTFTGYSALSIAAGLSDGATLDTIEVEDELEEMILSFFNKSPYKERIKLHIGSALDIVPVSGEKYDMVFIDGDKREYPAYYRMLMGDGEFSGYGASVHSGSYIIADNILWYGKVVEDVHHNDMHTKGIVEFNGMVRNDERAENIIIPLRDGLNIIRVK